MPLSTHVTNHFAGIQHNNNDDDDDDDNNNINTWPRYIGTPYYCDASDPRRTERQWSSIPDVGVARIIND